LLVVHEVREDTISSVAAQSFGHFRSIATGPITGRLSGNMKLFLHLTLLGGWLAPGPAQAGALNYLVDQAHDWPDAFEATHSLVAYPSVTQEFTPALGALDVVEVYTRDWSWPITNGFGGTLQVTRREEFWHVLPLTLRESEMRQTGRLTRFEL
jgi:hypothetical protein